MRTGRLLGRDHAELGRIACLAEGPLALALSRGGAAKTYSHRDPNEDAAAFAHGAGGCLLVVADGHGGHEAAEQAVTGLLEFAAGWTAGDVPEGDWGALAAAAVQQLHFAVVARGTDGGNRDARTTLSFALIRPGEDRWSWASVGDSHVFRVSAAESSERSPSEGKLQFLGEPSRMGGELGMRCGSEALSDTRGIVLASDGISERGIGVADPARAVTNAVEAGADHPAQLQPLEIGRALTRIALAAHREHRAGDNFTTALWIRP